MQRLYALTLFAILFWSAPSLAAEVIYRGVLSDKTHVKPRFYTRGENGLETTIELKFKNNDAIKAFNLRGQAALISFEKMEKLSINTFRGDVKWLIPSNRLSKQGLVVLPKK